MAIVSGPKAPARQRGTSNCRSCSPSAGQMASNYQMFKPKGPSKAKGNIKLQERPTAGQAASKYQIFRPKSPSKAEGSAKLKELSPSCWPTGLKMLNFQRPQQCRREPRARFRVRRARFRVKRARFRPTRARFLGAKKAQENRRHKKSTHDFWLYPARLSSPTRAGLLRGKG